MLLSPLSQSFHRLLAIRRHVVVNATAEPERVVPLTGREGPLCYVGEPRERVEGTSYST